jgi:hypothetical protein
MKCLMLSFLEKQSYMKFTILKSGYLKMTMVNLNLFLFKRITSGTYKLFC